MFETQFFESVNVESTDMEEYMYIYEHVYMNMNIYMP